MVRYDRRFKKRFLFNLATAGIKLFCSPFCRSIQGTEHLPKEPYLIASNHRSLMDGLVLVNEFNRIRAGTIHMLAYQEPFNHFFYGKILKVTGCIPFDRGSAESRVHALQMALGFLAAGEPVAIFPEAHLSKNNTMRRGRPGMAFLALESGVPVVPVGLRDTEKVLEPETGKVSLGVRATITVGEPISVTPWRDQFLNGTAEERNAAVEATTTTVMEAIAVLSGQTYPTPRKRRKRRPNK